MHLLRHTHILVHQRFVVRDHVFVFVGGAAFEGVGGPAEEVFPQCGGGELEEGEDADGAEGGAGGFAVEEEGEEAEAEGVALCVETVGGGQGELAFGCFFSWV